MDNGSKTDMHMDDLQIASEHRKGYEYVWFTNPLPLASIPSVTSFTLTCPSVRSNMTSSGADFCMRSNFAEDLALCRSNVKCHLCWRVDNVKPC